MINTRQNIRTKKYLYVDKLHIFKMDYGCSEKRNKGKDKKKRRKMFPYRRGGKFRAGEIKS